MCNCVGRVRYVDGTRGEWYPLRTVEGLHYVDCRGGWCGGEYGVRRAACHRVEPGYRWSWSGDVGSLAAYGVAFGNFCYLAALGGRRELVVLPGWHRGSWG